MISYDRHDDYDGEFLREIYLAAPGFLPQYVRYLVDSKDHHSLDDNYERVHVFLQLENSEEICDYIVDELIKGNPYPFDDVERFMKSLIMSKQGDGSLLQFQDKWIKHTICSSSDNTLKIECLFSAISEFPAARKAEYITLFLKYNQDFEAFEAIPLYPTSYSWSGSAIPLLSSWIKYLQLIMPNFIGLKYVRHKKYVEDEIDSLRKQIEKEQIKEILEG